MSHVPTKPAKLFLGLALAGLITSAAPAGAQANDRATDSIPVAARDLDLRTHTGAATLRHRVNIAARKLCQGGNNSSTLDSDAYGDCVRDAVHTVSLQVETLIAAAQGANQMASAAGPSR